ncbi:M24 family metallopeptidase [Cohnella hongkongensis]|uniref:M24 family metallopeptidase n=1 Tax=Cohnella hongkongensis TaxID=178337 RepID=A0ABV9F7C9_9BACL
MDKQRRFDKRLGEIRSALQSMKVEALRLTLQKNVSWLIGGRSHVNSASEPACCQFLITSDKCVLISNNIENRRLIEEEIGFAQGGITDNEMWSWFDPSELGAIVARHAPAGGRLLLDSEAEGDLLGLRTKLDGEDSQEARAIGRLTAEAISQAAFDVARGDSEFKIAGKLAYRCLERGLEPIVNLVAVDERIYERRHPLPTDKCVGEYAMLIVCTRKNGIVLSATRLVRFGPAPDELKRRHRAVAEIDARLIDATRPGVKLADLFRQMQAFYREAGFPEEYRHHHQGGLVGYNSREKIMTKAESLVVEAGQMYAWNPSVAGAKSEDTIFVEQAGNELLTSSGDFPSISVKAGGRVWERPDILIR